MKSLNFSCLIVVGIFLFSSCIWIKPNVFPQKPQDLRTRGEKNFDPWKGEEEQKLIIAQELIEEKLATDTSVTHPAKGRDSFDNSVSDRKINPEGLRNETCFRIQVFASIFPEETYRKADSLRAEFPESVYVQFESPYYKVRLGNFESRVEAEDFLERLIQEGYAEAWVVEIRRFK